MTRIEAGSVWIGGHQYALSVTVDEQIIAQLMMMARTSEPNFGQTPSQRAWIVSQHARLSCHEMGASEP